MTTVLYVDDEIGTENLTTKVEWLESRGLEVVSAEDAMAALSVFQARSNDIDVILLDVLMPPLNRYSLEETNQGTDTGLRLLKDLRAIRPDIPVILITVKPPHLVKTAKAQLGIEGYLYKPVLPVQILNEISRVLGRRP